MKSIKVITVFFVIALISFSTKAQIINLPNLLLDSTAPSGATIEYHTALPVSSNNLVANKYNVDTGKYYVVYNYGSCYSSPTSIRIISPTCPATTINVLNYVDSTAKPSGTSVSLHTAYSVSNNNKLNNTNVAAGKYYVAYGDVAQSCYSIPTIIIVKSNSCSTNPTVINDNATTISGTAVSVNVRANDIITNAGGSFGNPTITITPNHGLAVVNSNGTISYTSATGFVGLDSLQYQVCDTSVNPAKCNTAFLKINVTPVINYPTVINDNATTISGTAVSVNVRANDIITNAGGSFGNPTITTTPNHGSAVVNSNGTINYTSATGFVGLDSLQYQVCDTSVNPAKCNTAFLKINVTPVINYPTVINDNATTISGTAVSVNVRANDIITNAGGSFGNPTITITPNHGSAVVNSNGNISYTSATGFVGLDSLQYQVCDTSVNPAKCNTAFLKINVTPVINYPTVINDNATTISGTAVNVNVRANDIITNAGGSFGNPTITIAPNHGSAVVNSNGTISYTSANGFVGVDSLQYQVCDTSVNPAKCNTAFLKINVTPVINYPTVINDTTTTISGTAVSVNVRANDIITNAGGSFGNPTITITPNHGSAVVNSNGNISYTSATGFVGLDSLQYQVCDTSINPAKCNTAFLKINVTPVINYPTVINDNATTISGTAVSVNVRANDIITNAGGSFGNPTITIAPNHGSAVVNSNGTISYTSANGFVGVDSLQYQVCDTIVNPAKCNTAFLKINVTPVINYPTVINDNATTISGTAVSVNVRANDIITNAGGSFGNPTITITPSHGSAVVNSNGTISYTSATGFVGQDSLQYQVCDTSVNPAKCNTAFLKINVTPVINYPTVINDNATTISGTAVSVNVRANDIITNAGGSFGNPTITIAPNHGSAVVNSNGTISYTSANGFVGVDSLQYQVCDTIVNPAKCNTAFLKINVTPVNPPDITPQIILSSTDLHSNANFNILIKINEINNAPTSGLITIRIPRDNRITFTYNTALQTLLNTAVNNSNWTYDSTNAFFHVFTSTTPIDIHSFSSIGLVAHFDANNNSGKCTLSATIQANSGGETNTTNNNTSVLINYYYQ